VPIHAAIGFALPPAACITATALVSTLCPMFGSRALEASPRRALAFAGGLGGISILAALASALVPTTSATSPARVNGLFRQDEPTEGTTGTRVFVDTSWGMHAWGEPPAPMVEALGDPSRVRMEAAWPFALPAPSIDIPRIALAPPEVDVLESKAEGN